MTIPISAKGLAEFILGGPSKKAQIVRNILKPASKEAKAIALYYSQAIAIIRIYHAKGNDRSYLREAKRNLATKLEKAATPQARAKLQNNVRALDAYMEIYGTRKRKILPRPRIYYQTGQVKVSASPDLALEENGRLRLVKLGVRKKGDNPDAVRIMLRLMYQAAHANLSVEPDDVLYFDVANAIRVKGTPADADLSTTIDNACEILEGMC